MPTKILDIVENLSKSEKKVQELIETNNKLVDRLRLGQEKIIAYKRQNDRLEQTLTEKEERCQEYDDRIESLKKSNSAINSILS